MCDDRDLSVEKQLTPANITGSFRDVLTRPTEFYRAIRSEVGFVAPFLFLVAAGVVAGCLRTLLCILGWGVNLPFEGPLRWLIFIPVTLSIGLVIIAALMFGIWKIMGSRKNYATAFRCCAYATAVVPVMVVINLLPYLGTIAGMAWLLYLMVVASAEIHDIPKSKAWRVFGAIFVILSFLAVDNQYKTRRMVENFDEIQKYQRASTGR